MKQFKIAYNIIKFTNKISKTFYLLIFAQAIMRTAKILIGVYGLKLIIDGLVSNDYHTSIQMILIVLGSEFLINILEKKLVSMLEIKKQEIMQRVYQTINFKLMNIDYQHLEDPYYLDLSERSKYAINQFDALDNLFKSFADIAYYILVISSMFAVLITFNPLILLIIFATLLLYTINSRFSSKQQVLLSKKLGPINRKFNYYQVIVSDVTSAKDFSVYPLSDLMFDKYSSFLNQTNKVMINFYLKNAIYKSIFVMISVIQIVAIYSLVGLQSITLSVGVSLFVFLIAAATKTSEALSSFITSMFSFQSSSNMLEPLVELMNVEESEELYKDGQIASEMQSLRFDKVSFHYPNHEKIVLKDISFTINKGEKISIVGLNGAGKTTLVKLICRLYKPTSGTIYWNGIDINDYQYESFLNQIAAVFQDFKMFALTLHENVDMESKNREDVLRCIKQAGLDNKIASLEHGIDTYLSKEYHENGIEMSGGELQKLAIARAFYKNSSLIILDEPTSALDPLAEAEIYEHFSELVANRTSIYISHRMSSCVFSDRIIILDENKIQMIDTHEELMKQKNSRYYELFNSQAMYYQANADS
ncbi:ABC transporter ATP-binding protein [Mariniplasma anaerobium]|uniref:ABC transporter ATP-binding protein n=1 Tax=Mariniplasma anaerobium TaxID=2735436 RepID=A0A7U9XUT4_9MOLU|nr:ABC transporter ATP-binding protein [Mariniplasma anaerobium]BCR35222.1 ABC transporter ATP-binding protein [Mariniplasma anaerobium]